MYMLGEAPCIVGVDAVLNAGSINLLKAIFLIKLPLPNAVSLQGSLADRCPSLSKPTLDN